MPNARTSGCSVKVFRKTFAACTAWHWAPQNRRVLVQAASLSPTSHVRLTVSAHRYTSSSKWGPCAIWPCAICNGLQSSMEAILVQSKRVKFGHRLFATHPHVSDYILLKTQMGNENRWQIELLRRFGVYTFFREWEDPSCSDPLTLWRRCIRRNVGEVLSVICSRYPFVSSIKYNLKPFWLATQLYTQIDGLGGNFTYTMTNAHRPQ